MNQLKKDVRTVLLGIFVNGPQDNTVGVCGNVAKSLDDANIEFSDEGLDEILEPLFESWPEKSHLHAYPVGNWSMTPNRLFWSFHDKGRNMWGMDTRYGKARWDLLAHMIKEIDK